MGAYLIKFPRAYIRTLIFFGLFTITDIPAAFILVYWFLMQLFSGYGSIANTQVSSGGTAWFAHIGGFVAGMILVNVMGTRSRYVLRGAERW
jgi:membrane associated rhomboid family serine protease